MCRCARLQILCRSGRVTESKATLGNICWVLDIGELLVTTGSHCKTFVAGGGGPCLSVLAEKISVKGE